MIQALKRILAFAGIFLLACVGISITVAIIFFGPIIMTVVGIVVLAVFVAMMWTAEDDPTENNKRLPK